MNATLKFHFEQELTCARHLMAQGKPDAAFAHLERAHVLGQAFVIPHARSHWWFLKLELQRSHPLAAAGQLVRLVLGMPGSLTGLLPHGNTGGSNVSMFRGMPVANELRQIIEGRTPSSPARGKEPAPWQS